MCEHDKIDPNRRQILRFASGLGAMGALALVGCDKKLPTAPTDDEADTTTTSTNTTCVVTPELTEGPYFADGTLERSDIVSGQSGLPLELAIGFYDASSNSCGALSDVLVDIWHANALGDYSGGASSYLRGHQITDSSGMVSFSTIYPGWYQGRATHIHLKARIYDANGDQTLEATTQIFFDDSITDEVYQQPPYNTRGERDTRNSRDGIYPGAGNIVALSGTATSMFMGSFTIGVVTS